MVPKSKVWLFLGLLIILAFTLASCAQPEEPPEEVATQPPATQPAPGEELDPGEEPPAEEPEEPPPPAADRPEGTLVVALSTFPNTLDGNLTAERQAHNAAGGLYDSLVWIDDDGEIVPALAESWEISDDGLEYIFNLRQDVTFHNGEQFNADAVVYSWEYYRNPELAWNERWRLADNVEKVDDFTIEITTDAPKPMLLRTIAIDWSIVPPLYHQELGEIEFGNNPVGTGPFEFVEWVKGDRIVLRANPNYWDAGYPKVETLIFRPIPESSTRVAAIQTGEVDIVPRLSADEAESLRGVPGVEVISYPVSRVFYIAFNNVTSGVGQPTEDPLVRQAMNYAVDIEAIVDALFDGQAKPSTGFVATGEMGYGAVEPFSYDPDMARDLLAQAGYPDGFEMGFACPAGAYTNFEEVCQAVQAYLGEVGIVTDLEIMESGYYWDLEAAKELPPLFGDSWSEISGEAYNRMAGALLGWDASYSSWEDATIKDYLHRISTTVDFEERLKLYEDMQAFMMEDPPFIYLYEPFAFEATRDYVRDYRPRSAEQYYLFYTWVDK
ncbi:MAG: ABC transporter substrate-binding protein [Anaerolineales bacterium]